jgi:anti-sigma regulatory factor (Ser/Thr protein kinase)/PAS domain-containing protein
MEYSGSNTERQAPGAGAKLGAADMTGSDRRIPDRIPDRLALRLALLYAAVASLWILVSDRFVDVLGLSRGVERDVSSLKGLGFVLVTAVFLFVFARRWARRLDLFQRRYWRLFENASEGITLFQVERDEHGALADLVVADVNPIQAERTQTPRRQTLGSRMTRQAGPDERLRSYFDLVAGGVAAGHAVRAELRVSSENAHELLVAYPIETDLWALAAMDVTETRRAEEVLRKQEEHLRQAYVDVIDAVTGGKLILLPEDDLATQLGAPLCIPTRVKDAAQVSSARRVVAQAAAAGFPGWNDFGDLLSPVCEALNNAVKHAQGGTYQVYAKDGRLQVAIVDEGPGVDFRTLPKATLTPGFSTAASLGMGFTIMLQLCDRVLLSTRPGRTEIVLEVEADSEAAAQLLTSIA